jgi:hypothetical protein
MKGGFMVSERKHAGIASDRSQLRTLKEHRDSLIRKRELAEKLRQHNVEAIQRPDEPLSPADSAENERP